MKFFKFKVPLFKSKRNKNFIITIVILFCFFLTLVYYIQVSKSVCPEKVWVDNHISGCVILRGNDIDKVVYLTFDDGPDPINTPKILNILEKQNIKATFFLIGEKVERYPQVALQIEKSGHEIGSHGYSHSDYYNLRSNQILQDIRLAQSAIVKATANNPTLLRPPFGRYDKTIASISRDEHLSIIIWSLDPKDFRKNANQDQIIKVIDSEVSNGSIILLHETSDETVRALPEIINRLKEKGFIIKSI